MERQAGEMLYGRGAILCACFVAILPSLLITTRAGADERISLFPLPSVIQAGSITAGSDGGIWFSGFDGSRGYGSEAVVGRVSPKGAVSELPLPAERSAGQIVVGPDGNLWFTMWFYNHGGYLIGKIARITPAGEFAEYRLNNAVGRVNSIAAGPDGHLWFTTRFWRLGRLYSEVGRISTSGEVTRFPLSARNVPGAIAAGPDGNLWFTVRGLTGQRPGRQRGRDGVSRIARITPTGQITQFPLPDRNRIPRSIAVGPDGNLWFGEEVEHYSQRGRGNKIGRITTSGSITEFPVPGRGGTKAITAGPAGNIWFIAGLSEGQRYAIGSITPTGRPGELICLKDDCELIPKSLTGGPEGDLWFTAGRNPTGKPPLFSEAGFVGRLSPSPR